MFCEWIVLAVAVGSGPQSLEEEEMALMEQMAVMDDEASEDGELVFDDQEPLEETDEAD